MIPVKPRPRRLPCEFSHVRVGAITEQSASQPSAKPKAETLSDDGVATLFEDAEGSRAHGHEVSIAIADSGLDGGDAACAVDDLGGAGDPTLTHSTEEVDVEADGGRPQADERGHREPHRVVYERGVDPAVQRPVAVEVDAFHVYVADGLPRLDLLDLALDMPREGNLLVDTLQTRTSSLSAPLTFKVPSGN